MSTSLHRTHADHAAPALPGLAVPAALLAHWSRILQLCLGQSERAVGEMLQALTDYSSAQAAPSEGTDRLGRVYEALQYQDRQRQALELLVADLQAAMALSPQQAAGLDMDAWLDHFEAHCPIPEMRRNPLAAPAAGAPGDTGLDYF